MVAEFKHIDETISSFIDYFDEGRNFNLPMSGEKFRRLGSERI